MNANSYFFKLLFLFTIIISPLFSSETNKPLTTNSDTKICLTMIVKNESRIIKRCLDSVKNIVDCICICDTGSSDNTVEIIEAYLKENGIPGEVYHHTWKNFGHNRTLSAKAAQETLKTLNFNLQKTYLLFLDADMVLVIKPEFNKQSLVDDCYLLSQKNVNISYYNLRVAKASLPWESLGVTHEYWASPMPHKRTQLDSLEIDDREDGGAKADKFERDVKLLTQGLIDEPGNERYMFYLAQSYKCLKDFDTSIKWYKDRIAKGGWKEEVWYSYFMIGDCYKEMGDDEKAIQWYLDAFQYNPSRAETLQKVANHYRLNGKNELAYLYAKHGSQIPFPKDQLLFISYPVYEYQFDEEISIAAYYTGKKSEGLEASNRLILNKNVPQSIKKQAYNNLIFYVERLKNVAYKPIQINLPWISPNSSLHYNPTNPSILKTQNGYDLIVKTVNYVQEGATHYKTLDADDPKNIIKTINILVKMDKNFNILSQHEIVENLPRKKMPWRALEGLEDCRIFNLNGETWFTCTTDDTHPDHHIEISACKVVQDSNKEKLDVAKLQPLRIPTQKSCEKNWLPFVLKGEPYFVYGYDPFDIYKVDLETGKCDLAYQSKYKQDFSSFRGSAAPVEFDNGYLMMVHEVAFGKGRSYFHRFLFLDKDFKITKISKPFIFQKNGIEFCAGMTVDHQAKHLVMAVGIEDREAKLAAMELDTVRKMLEPLH